MAPVNYKVVRLFRIVISLAVAAVITVAVGCGYSCFMTRMQVVPALLACSGLWVGLWTAVTALVGRIYCSTACPMGTLQDVLIRFSRRRRRGFFYRAPATALRWSVVVLVVAAFVLGFTVVVAVLDPYSAFARIVVYLGVPGVDAIRDALGHGPVRPAAVSLAAALTAALTLALVAVVSLTRGRLLCNTLCPVGTLLGALSRYSVYHVDINTDKCVGCGRCTAACKASCIDASSHTVDLSRCVVCFDCVAGCPSSAITFRRGRHRLKMPMLQPVARAGQAACDAPAPHSSAVAPIDRRAFIAALCSAGAVSAVGQSTDVSVLRPVNYVYPPGAASRGSFERLCTSCGACVAVCPSGVIRPSGVQLGMRNALHPVMDYDYGPCLYDCVKCTRVCPTGALQPLTPGQKHRTPIGRARVVSERCIIFVSGEPCGECVRRCPAAAISVVPTDSAFSDGRVRKLPMVDAGACIGCGACRWVCPSEPRAIVIEGE